MENSYNYRYDVGGENNEIITLHWVAEKKDEKQQAGYFNQLISATLTYYLESLIKRLVDTITKGRNVNMGECVLTNKGICYDTTKFFVKREYLAHWSDVVTGVKAGIVTVYSLGDKSFRVELNMREDWNAVILPHLADYMKTLSSDHVN